MQLQSQQEQVTQQPRRLLRRPDALAWTILGGLLSVSTIVQTIGRLLEHRWPSESVLIMPFILALILRQWHRVQRGEKVKDPLSYPEKASWRSVVLGIIGAVFFFALSVLLIVVVRISPPRHSFPLFHFSMLCYSGALLVIAGLLTKWVYREYRRIRFGDSVEQLELFDQAPPATQEQQAIFQKFTVLAVSGGLVFGVGLVLLLIANNTLPGILLLLVGAALIAYLFSQIFRYQNTVRSQLSSK